MMNRTALTILSAYNSLNDTALSIDECVYNTAIHSHNMNMTNFLSTEKQTDKIISLINRKIDLINLKVLTDKILSIMNVNQSTLLTEKFINGLKNEKLIEKLGISNNTFYRRLHLSVNNFGKRVVEINCDKNWFEKNYLVQPWIKKLYEKMAKVADGSRII